MTSTLPCRYLCLHAAASPPKRHEAAAEPTLSKLGARSASARASPLTLSHSGAPDTRSVESCAKPSRRRVLAS